MARASSFERFARNFRDIEELIDENELSVHDPFSMLGRSYYLLDTNGVHDDLCTVSLVQGLAEALELPSNVSLNDVLSLCQ